MKEHDKINRIIKKISQLKNIDTNFEVFGSKRHKYEFNKTLSEKEIIKFENENGILLPKGYKMFLNMIGNGGAGPYYGLEPLENGKYSDLDYKNKDDLIDLSKSFLHTEHWNIDLGEYNGKEYEKKETEYFDNKWINGLLKISNFGCGISLCLVVNGKEYGNIWVDDRCNDQGLYPAPYFKSKTKLSFLDWYELWLDIEIKKAGNKV